MKWEIQDKRSRKPIVTGSGKTPESCKKAALKTIIGKDFPNINPAMLEIVVKPEEN